jgi:hypothetical protein
MGSLLLKIVFCFLYLSLPENARGDEGVLAEFKLPRSLVNFDKLFGTEGDGKEKSLGKYITATVSGAKYGESCDYDLYRNYIKPIYDADDRIDFGIRMQNFLQQLQSNSTLEALSCFSHIPAGTATPEILRFMKCNEANMKCDCNDEEPYKSIKVLNSTEKCKVRRPILGSPCKRARTDILNKVFYSAFRRGINDAINNNASTNKDYVNTWNTLVGNFKLYLDDYSLESDRRRACFNIDWESRKVNEENLECSPEGYCVCVNQGKRFGYFEAEKRCYAKKDAICELKGAGATLSSTECSVEGKRIECRQLRAKVNPQLNITLCDSEESGHSIGPSDQIMLALLILSIAHFQRTLVS